MTHASNPSEALGGNRFPLKEELERCRVIAREVGRRAARTELVRFIRKELLGDPQSAVNGVRAEALLRSPASHYLPLGFFAEHGIPWSLHHCEDVKEPARVTRDPVDGDFRNVSFTLCGPKGRRVSWAGKWILKDPSGVRRPRQLWIPLEHGRSRHVEVEPGSPGDWLASVADQGAGGLLWSAEQYVWFALTGESPVIRPVTERTEVALDENASPLRAQIVFTVQSFVTIRTLTREIRRAMQYVVWEQGNVRHGPPMRLRTLALFEFVEAQREVNAGSRPSWGTLLKRWDAAHPEWAYTDRSHLRRDYERAVRLLRRDAEALAPPYMRTSAD